MMGLIVRVGQHIVRTQSAKQAGEVCILEAGLTSERGREEPPPNLFVDAQTHAMLN